MTTMDYGILAPAWAATGAADLVDDNALLTAMLATEVALAEAQAELGMIPAGAAAAIRAAAVPATIDLAAVAAGVRDTANPVVAFVEQLTAAVRSVDASAAEYVHRGSTSQDILDTALTLLCAATLDRIGDDLLACAASLAGHADRHRDTPMAGRTLTQHAVPITFGLKAATWLHLVLDAVERVRRTRAALPVSLGGAAGTLAAYHQYALETTWASEATGDYTDPADATLRLPALVAQSPRAGRADAALARSSHTPGRCRREPDDHHRRARQDGRRRPRAHPDRDRGGHRGARAGPGGVLGHAAEAQPGVLDARRDRGPTAATDRPRAVRFHGRGGRAVLGRLACRVATAAGVPAHRCRCRSQCRSPRRNPSGLTTGDGGQPAADPRRHRFRARQRGTGAVTRQGQRQTPAGRGDRGGRARRCRSRRRARRRAGAGRSGTAPTCPGCSIRPATPGCPVPWSSGCSPVSTTF